MGTPRIVETRRWSAACDTARLTVAERSFAHLHSASVTGKTGMVRSNA
jgi:hypothetical protein